MSLIPSSSLIHAWMTSWKIYCNLLALSIIMGPLGIEISSTNLTHVHAHIGSGSRFLFKQIWEVKVPPRVALFAWETGRGCILTIDKWMREMTMVNRCYLKRMLNLVIMFLYSILLLTSYGLWFTNYWISVGGCRLD